MITLDISSLVYGEQLVLWASRRWLADRLDWDKVAHEFALSLGCARGWVALEALEELLRITAGGARRTIYLHRLPCCRVSVDEHALLTILAALQAGRRAHAQALLQWLLQDAAARTASAPAEMLAAALDESGIRLPLRSAAGATPVPLDEKATHAVH